MILYDIQYKKWVKRYLIGISNNIIIMLDLCISNYHFMYCGELRFSKGGLGVVDSS